MGKVNNSNRTSLIIDSFAKKEGTENRTSVHQFCKNNYCVQNKISLFYKV